MDEWTRAALDADVTAAAAAVQVAAVTEAGRRADGLLREAGLGEWPAPPSPSIKAWTSSAKIH
ncbi:hypothetical protein ACVGOW_07940 [Pseudonocardia saturnea]